MKSANWELCSLVSINSELGHFREIRSNLSECISTLPEDADHTLMSMAL
jgi:hypothetical protein